MKWERLLTAGAAGLLIAGVWVIPAAEWRRDASRRAKGVGAALAAQDSDTMRGEERIAGRRERTMVRPVMPKPVFVGSPIPDGWLPQNMIEGQYSNLREVEIPRRVELLSAGAPVTSSDPAPIGELSLVTDGDKAGDDGYFVDVLGGLQWVQIDLGAARELWLIWQWKYHKHPVIYKDVIIEVASREDFGDARIVFNNDYDDSAGMGAGNDPSWKETNWGFPIKLNGIMARYVRLYSNGRSVDDTNHWIEVEVYGR